VSRRPTSAPRIPTRATSTPRHESNAAYTRRVDRIDLIHGASRARAILASSSRPDASAESALLRRRFAPPPQIAADSAPSTCASPTPPDADDLLSRRPPQFQPRKGIHPLLYRISIVGTKGATFPWLSAVPFKAGKFFCQTDQDTHVLWTGKKEVKAATGQVAKFKRRFDYLSEAELPGGNKRR
jgi:ribosomal protein L31